MHILILGGTGFIGAVVAARLSTEGHIVTCLSRKPGRMRIRQPAIRWIAADLSTMTAAADWTQVLDSQDVVISCAGALQDGLSDHLAATQTDAMLALYAAAQKPTRPLIVQISARTSGAASDLPFLATKRRADDALAASGLPYVIIRPALVLGRNAHGGSALLRALAAFPFCLPLVHASNPVETVSLDDVATAVSDAVSGRLPVGTDIDLAGSQTLPLAELVGLHRQWLGLPPAPVISIPPAAARPITALADLAGRLGWRSPLRSTAMTVMSEGVRTSSSTGTYAQVTTTAATLAANPAGVQDLWFARLYLTKPLMIGGLSVFWLLSGLIPLARLEQASAHFLPFMPPVAATALTVLTCLLDVALGTAILVRPFARRALLAMLATSLAYLAGSVVLEPALWLDPLGPMVKVIPALILTLATLAILDER
jgi:uncharacterized protein YbjT (DUF2867 family)